MEEYCENCHKGKEIKYNIKKYAVALSLSGTRIIFGNKTSMKEHVKLNYKGMKRYEAVGWKCVECSNLDSELCLLW